MIAIPAVDLRDGACVQLVGGSFADERVRIPDPLAAARRWKESGFARIHVVDLDAAMGVGSNARAVADLITGAGMATQVGGGLRTSKAVAGMIALGADRVVVGTRAVEDPRWLAELASTYPGRVIVAADVRDRHVVTHGWTRSEKADIADFVRSITAIPLAGLLLTAVHREGQLQGTDLALMEEVAALSAAPVIASGGIASIDEMRALASLGVSALVLGMSLYTGVLDPRAVAEEFAQ